MNYLKKLYRKLRWISKRLSAWVYYGHLTDTVIVVYSMGKVASSTVYSTLKKQLPTVSIFHVHFLSDYWLNQKLPFLDSFYHSHIEVGKQILKYRKDNPNKRLKIITLVREPIIREISGIFENAPGIFGKNVDIRKVDLAGEMDRRSYEYSLNWFDTEFKRYTNFDIYSVPFDRERGYSIYHCPDADILCLKVEMLNSVYKQAFKEFLNVSNVDLVNSNTVEDRRQKDLYFELKKSYKPPLFVLENLYKSKYVRHFYSEKEIELFVATWKEQPDNVLG